MLAEYGSWDIGDKTRVRAVHDETYQTVGSYAYDTEAETKAAEDTEIAGINSGELVVLGLIHEKQCPHCDQWHPEDAIWGCVVGLDDEEILALAGDYFDLETKGGES